MGYRGRIAPSPTGFMHLGHASTFLVAQKRAQEANGKLVFRLEDIDRGRCKPEYIDAVYEDLYWAGVRWDEGGGFGGNFGPYVQSERLEYYEYVWRLLYQKGMIYPCDCSRSEILIHAEVAHGEIIFPRELRADAGDIPNVTLPGKMNWRFRVPYERRVHFNDLRSGCHFFEALKDFGDFLVWRRDGWPSYELAVVADDHAMQITEVVRGGDLLISTARQILLYEALCWSYPDFYHCPLVLDKNGNKLSKSNGCEGLKVLREKGLGSCDVKKILENYFF